MAVSDKEEIKETGNPKSRVSRLHKAEVLDSGLRGLRGAQVASVESSAAVASRRVTNVGNMMAH